MSSNTTGYRLPLFSCWNQNINLLFHAVLVSCRDAGVGVLIDVEVQMSANMSKNLPLNLKQKSLFELLVAECQLLAADENRPQGQFGISQRPTIAFGARYEDLVGKSDKRPYTLIFAFSLSKEFPFSSPTVRVPKIGTQMDLTFQQHLEDFFNEVIPRFEQRIL